MTPKAIRHREEAIESRFDNAGICSGGLFDCDCACAAPVNNQPLADASVASAKVMADLGDRQLAETRRQYDLNSAIAKPVVDAQLQIMQQTKDQGDDYYSYLKTFRPTEQKMLAESNQDNVANNADERNAIIRAGIIGGDIQTQAAQDAADRKLLTSSRNKVYESDQGNIESQVGTAISDTRAGFSRTLNQAIREGARYGMSPASIVANMGVIATDQASREVAAANAARESGIDSVLTRTAAGREMRQSDFDRTVGFKSRDAQTLSTGRNMRLQDSATDWAKKLDVVGIAKGLPGASQGAYSLANQSGNSAVSNQNSNSQTMLNGMAQSAGLTAQGQQMKLQGLTSILNSDTAIAQSNNAREASQGGSSFGGMLSGLGGLGQGLGAMGFKVSSKKLKTNKKKMSPVLDGIKNLNIQDWRYKQGVADGGEHSGPYAEDVNREFGDRAAPGGKVLDNATMQGIMLKGIQELAVKVDRLEGGKKPKRKGRVIEGKARRVE